MEKFLGLGFFHVRLTTTKDICEIENFIKRHSSKYLISSEITHYHCLCYLEGDPIYKNSKFRADLKQILQIDGNKAYSISRCRSQKQLMKYTLKDAGTYVYSGFDDEQISAMSRCSYKKGKDKFAEELADLEEQFINDKYMTIHGFGEKLVKLKVSYNHNLHSNHLVAYLRKMEIKKHGHVAVSRYVEQLLANF